MVNDATKKFREPIAFGLLAVSALWFIGAVSLLFKSYGLEGSPGFATRAAFVGGLFESPIAVVSLAVAGFLVTGLDGPTRNARAVVLGALGIAGLDLLFGVITFFAQFGSDVSSGYLGVVLAGKVVGVLLGLAALLFLSAATCYLAFALRGLPAPATTKPQWSGAPGGYAGYGQQVWGQPGQGTVQGPGQQAQTGWGQQPPAAGWGAPTSTPAPSPAPPPGWGAPQAGQGQGWDPNGAQPPGWEASGGQGWSGAPGPARQPATGGWEQQPAPGGWEQPPAPSGWQQPGQPGWGQQPGYEGTSAGQQGWQWAQETEPAPSTWIQQAPTYGDAPTSYVETPSDPVWTQSDYGTEAAGPGWTQPESAEQPDAEGAPSFSAAETTALPKWDEVSGHSVFEGDDDTAAPSDFAAAADDAAPETSPGDEHAGGDAGDDGGDGSGWWQPSQR